MCCCALFVGNIPPMSLQNPKIPSKSKRAKMADETELFCISASKTVVFARLLGVRQRPPQGAEFVCVPCGANNSKSSAARRAGSSPATGTTASERSPLRSKIRQLKTSCRIFRLRSLAPPFQLRPAALGSQFIGFVFALFAASRVYDRALKICDDLKFKP